VKSVWWLVTGWAIEFKFPAGKRTFFLTTTPRLALGPTQPLIHSILGVKQLGMVTTHLHPVLRWRMCGIISSLPHTSSWQTKVVSSSLLKLLHRLILIASQMILFICQPWFIPCSATLGCYECSNWCSLVWSSIVHPICLMVTTFTSNFVNS